MKELEKQRSVDQLAHPARAARPELFARPGSVAGCFRRRGDQRLGSYYRLRYRDGVFLRSVYLVAAGPLVDRVINARDGQPGAEQPPPEHCARALTPAPHPPALHMDLPNCDVG